jgi:hypothetical protein
VLLLVVTLVVVFSCLDSPLFYSLLRSSITIPRSLAAAAAAAAAVLGLRAVLGCAV